MRRDTSRFATVLFLDVVGSTRIAEDIGDEAWRSLLRRFRSLVRHELKRFGGHEVDTAGDGFFVTFTDPTAALRAALAIDATVQRIGVEVRLGVHAGEVESDGKHVSGITVHIGARVMGLAGASQILVTSTIRDMVRGVSATFEDAGDHTLKGVEGIWQLFSLKELGGESLPAPLENGVAAERRRETLATSARRRTPLVVASAVVVLLIGSTVFALARLHHPARAIETNLAMLKIDLASQQIVGSVRVPTTQAGPVWAPGNVGDEIVRITRDYYELRDLSTGELRDEIPVKSWLWVSIGAGYVWVDSRVGVSEPVLYRIAPQTGRTTGHSVRAGSIADPPAFNIWWGSHGGWTYDVSAAGDSLLTNINPVTLEVKQWHLPLGNWQIPVAYRRGVWTIDPSNRQLAWLDFSTNRVTVQPIPKGDTLIVEGLDTYSPRRVWLFDPDSGFFTPLGNGSPDPSGEFFVDGAPEELSAPQNAMYADGPVLDGTLVDGTLWVAVPLESTVGRQDSVVVGIKTTGTGTPVVVTMPDRFVPYFLIPDPTDDAIWVSASF